LDEFGTANVESKFLSDFIENGTRSCSMDFGGITPLYVYRMWGGQFSMEEIENGLTELRKQGTFMVHE